MNIWLGVFTVFFIFSTTVIIFIKQRNIRNATWNFALAIVAGVSLYIGQGVMEIWEILLCSIIIGAGLLISAIHAYNKLFRSGIRYESIGSNETPRPFGNGYWR